MIKAFFLQKHIYLRYWIDRSASKDGLWDCAILEVADHDLETVSHSGADGSFDETRHHASRVEAHNLLQLNSSIVWLESSVYDDVVCDNIGADLSFTGCSLCFISLARMENGCPSLSIHVVVKSGDDTTVRDDHGHAHFQMPHLLPVVVRELLSCAPCVCRAHNRGRVIHPLLEVGHGQAIALPLDHSHGISVIGIRLLCDVLLIRFLFDCVMVLPASEHFIRLRNQTCLDLSSGRSCVYHHTSKLFYFQIFNTMVRPPAQY